MFQNNFLVQRTLIRFYLKSDHNTASNRRFNMKKELDEHLIHLVKEHPNLYDKNHELYEDILKQKSSWYLIGQQIRLDAATTKCRWEYLLETFIDELKAFPLLSEGANYKFPENMKKFKQMLFLIPHLSECAPAPKIQTANLELPEREEMGATGSLPDEYFMESLLNDMQRLTLQEKLEFKKDVLQLLEQRVCCQ